MIEFLVCPVEIIVREPLIPLEAGSQKTGSLRLVATGIGSNLRKSTVRRRSLSRQNLLRHDYMPVTLPHRGEQIRRLGSVLAPALTKDRVSNLFAYGKTGTGKTIVTKFVLDRLQRKAREHGRALDTSYVNCRLAGTNYRDIADLCRSLGREVPFTGLAVGELLDRFRSALQSRGSAFLVVLDEIDALVKRSEDDSLLYELTRINEKLTDGWIGLIGISNDLHFKDFLD